MKAYDPSALVEQAVKQYPNDPWLADALRKCTAVVERSEYYIRFVDTSSVPELKHLAAPIKDSMFLEDTPEGEVVLDILHNGQVGGMELYEKLLKTG
ncbi:MAG: hypothetical protein A2283_06285 [Lentisphaerae bacterium RIFOXYA12_FULL_48_11]|nr:MAG: hypothetical protein A2283_06285 [Lentisphaerae bacterium RIFOXYA12_FULL_48_11]